MTNAVRQAPHVLLGILLGISIAAITLLAALHDPIPPILAGVTAGLAVGLGVAVPTSIAGAPYATTSPTTPTTPDQTAILAGPSTPSGSFVVIPQKLRLGGRR